MFEHDVVVVGGAGHVGLPLAVALAGRGARVVVQDRDAEKVAAVAAGSVPFAEDGAEPELRRVLAEGRLTATTDPGVLGTGETVVVTIGTPVDEHLNPDLRAVPRFLDTAVPHLRDGQLVVLRSTLYPGVTAMVARHLADAGLDVDVACCPERLAEGRAMAELTTLPQIVGGVSARAAERAEKVFRRLTDTVVHLGPEEAELAKLFTNSWRYLKFAAANQFYMIANDYGLDFERIRAALAQDYPRAADLPRAGFAAGPCLFKDTMQLAAYNDNHFSLGHAAMLVNEGLPLYVVSRLAGRFDLASTTVGILGMAFKADVDDTRSSLSYKLKRLLEFRAREVLTTDPYVSTDPDLLPLDEVLARADLLVVGAPHAAYRSLRTDVPVADVWGVVDGGVRV